MDTKILGDKMNNKIVNCHRNLLKSIKIKQWKMKKNVSTLHNCQILNQIPLEIAM